MTKMCGYVFVPFITPKFEEEKRPPMRMLLVEKTVGKTRPERKGRWARLGREAGKSRLLKRPVAAFAFWKHLVLDVKNSKVRIQSWSPQPLAALSSKLFRCLFYGLWVSDARYTRCPLAKILESSQPLYRAIFSTENRLLRLRCRRNTSEPRLPMAMRNSSVQLPSTCQISQTRIRGSQDRSVYSAVGQGHRVVFDAEVKWATCSVWFFRMWIGFWLRLVASIFINFSIFLADLGFCPKSPNFVDLSFSSQILKASWHSCNFHSRLFWLLLHGVMS